MSDSTQADLRCVNCTKPLSADASFCSSCGTKVVDPPVTAFVEMYLTKRLDDEIAKRLKDQTGIARDLADKAEDAVWKRLKLLGFTLAIIVAAAAAIGYQTVDSLKKSAIEAISGPIEIVKTRIAQLSREVDEQTRRVSERGNEIETRLVFLDKTAADVQTNARRYQQRADELSAKMDQTIANLASRMDQISTQVDQVSVVEAYPSLGQKKVVTLNGKIWAGDPTRGAGKLVWIIIFAYAIPDFTSDQVQSLVSDLKRAGYTPILGQFGVGGPFNSGVGNLGGGTVGTTINYFASASKAMSDEVRGIVIKDLNIPDAPTRYVPAETMLWDDLQRFVIENSGINFQIVIQPRIAQ